MKNEQRIVLGLVTALLCIAYLLTKELPFFWDGVSKAGRAHWIFSNQFTTFVVPTDINSGHPPLWIVGLAFTWEVLGQSLWSSRLLLLLANLAVAYQIVSLARKTWSPKLSFYWILLVFLDPTLIALSLHLNNDMLLLLCCLAAINGLLAGKTWLYTIAICGLLLTNLRGLYCVIALAGAHFWLVRTKAIKLKKVLFLAYGVGALTISLFFLYQYREVGWWLLSPNPKYSGHREVIDASGILKNTIAYIKYYLDFGRVFIWLITLWIIFKLKHPTSLFNNINIKKLVILIICFDAVFYLGIALSTSPLGARHQVLLYVLITLLFIKIVHLAIKSKRQRKLIVLIVVIGLFTGNFWIYPKTIAQAWDSSLAFLNYRSIEEAMLEDIKQRQIPFDRIGTHLPLNNRHTAYLDWDSKFTPSFATLDLEQNQFVLFSNVENTTSDNQIKALEAWKVVSRYEQLGVFIVLYERP